MDAGPRTDTLVITPEIRELVLRRSPESDIEALARTQGMQMLREQAIAKVAAHLTTLDEVFRTTIGGSVEE